LRREEKERDVGVFNIRRRRGVGGESVMK